MTTSIATRTLFALALCTAVAAPQAAAPAAPAAGSITAAVPVGLRFVENAGQWDGPAAFAVRVGGTHTFFEPGAIVVRVPEIRPIEGPGVQIAGAPARPAVTLPAAEVAFVFDGAATHAPIVGRDPLQGEHCFYIGSDASRWRSGLHAWGALEYGELWPSISLVVNEREGSLHYDVVVEPGADLDAFALRAEGALGARVEADGSLVAETARGAIRQTIPAAWDEDTAGVRYPVQARFVARGPAAVFGLAVTGHDASRRLVIDPGFDFSVLVVSAFGPGVDLQYYSIAVDPLTGAQVVAGWDGPDAVVSSYDITTGAFFWTTIIAGPGFDQAVDLAFDAAGDIYFSGVTDSPFLPTTPGVFMPVAPGLGDAFVGHLGPGGVLIDLSYIGGTFGTEASNTTIDIGPDGLITLAGYTESADFPIGPAGLVFDPTYNFGGDAWVMRMPPTLAFFFNSTFLGGPFFDTPGIGGVAVAPDGTVSVGGWTESAPFPILLAVDPAYGGATDAFLTKLTPTLGGLVFSTYRGGALFDAFNAVEVDDTAAVWGAGYTESGGIPFMGPPPAVLDFTYNGFGDVLLVKHTPVGGFLWGTYRGGSGSDSAMRIAVDRFGRAHISGTTSSGYPPSAMPFPVTPPDGIGPVDVLIPGAGSFDGLVACIGPDGDMQSLSGYFSFLIGGDESLSGIALDAAGNAFLCGVFGGPVVPAFNAPIARCTFPWSDAGFALAGTTEPQLMGDGTLVGGAPLELRLSNVVPGTAATLVVGVAPLFAPFRGGTMVPLPLLLVPGLVAGPAGEAVLAAAWPPGIPADTLMWLQAWMPDVAGPLGFAASNGVVLTTP